MCYISKCWMLHVYGGAGSADSAQKWSPDHKWIWYWKGIYMVIYIIFIQKWNDTQNGQKFQRTRISLTTAYKMEIVSSCGRPWAEMLCHLDIINCYCSLVHYLWQEMNDKNKNRWDMSLPITLETFGTVTSLPSLKDLAFLYKAYKGHSCNGRNTCTLCFHHTSVTPLSNQSAALGDNGSEILVCVTCRSSQYSQVWSQKVVLIIQVLFTALTRSHLSVVHSNR